MSDENDLTTRIKLAGDLLSPITKAGIKEIAAFNIPPELLGKVLECTRMVVGADDWKHMLKDPNFIYVLMRLNIPAIPLSVIREIRAEMDNGMTVPALQRVSAVGANLLRWLEEVVVLREEVERTGYNEHHHHHHHHHLHKEKAPDPLADPQVEADAIAALEAGAAALNCLSRASISELSAYVKPPPLVRAVLEAVAVMLGESDWRVMIKSKHFLQMVLNFEKDGVSPRTVAKVKKMLAQEDVTQEKCKKVSLAAASLLAWLEGMVAYTALAQAFRRHHAPPAPSDEDVVEKAAEAVDDVAAPTTHISAERIQAPVGDDEAALVAALENAAASLNCISKSSISELASHSNPPSIIRSVLEAVAVMLGEKDWRTMIKSRNFLSTLLHFDKDGVSPRTVAKVKGMLHDSGVTQEKCKKASNAGACLLAWLEGMITYSSLSQAYRRHNGANGLSKGTSREDASPRGTAVSPRISSNSASTSPRLSARVTTPHDGDSESTTAAKKEHKKELRQRIQELEDMLEVANEAAEEHDREMASLQMKLREKEQQLRRRSSTPPPIVSSSKEREFEQRAQALERELALARDEAAAAHRKLDEVQMAGFLARPALEQDLLTENSDLRAQNRAIGQDLAALEIERDNALAALKESRQREATLQERNAEYEERIQLLTVEVNSIKNHDKREMAEMRRQITELTTEVNLLRANARRVSANANREAHVLEREARLEANELIRDLQVKNEALENRLAVLTGKGPQSISADIERSRTRSPSPLRRALASPNARVRPRSAGPRSPVHHYASRIDPLEGKTKQLKGVTSKDIMAIAKETPDDGTRLVMSAACLLMGNSIAPPAEDEVAPSWEKCVSILKRHSTGNDFVQALMRVDARNLSYDTHDALRPFIDHALFDPHITARRYKSVQFIAAWVRAVYDHIIARSM